MRSLLRIFIVDIFICLGGLHLLLPLPHSAFIDSASKALDLLRAAVFFSFFTFLHV